MKECFDRGTLGELGSEQNPVGKHEVAENEGLERQNAVKDSVNRFEVAFVQDYEEFIVFCSSMVCLVGNSSRWSGAYRFGGIHCRV
mmetsp:Transcript_3605/g.3909  ORF Transcript_3605/g.3909 Transcript_3605/m.3909 type:complete len:86 (+) Transcript_3605:618-875(+)